MKTGESANFLATVDGYRFIVHRNHSV